MAIVPVKADENPNGAAVVLYWPSMNYWLMKSEEGCFSFDDLLKSPKKTTYWDGVRNFEARNFMRDRMKKKDGVLFYHTLADPPGVFGVAEIAREGYPDFTAFDEAHEHFDPKSKSDAPTWFMVDIRAVQKLPKPVTLAMIRAAPELHEMALLKRNRLSVTAVTPAEWKVIMKLGGLGAGK